MVEIIGGGLAGCEAAWQIATRGVPVKLYEMRPVHKTRVHKSSQLAELVCSNSFRGAQLENAVGLLKEEMRSLGSLIMRIALKTQVPAGGALAVDRTRFAEHVTEAINSHPLITVSRREISRIPKASAETSAIIIATGPLTSESLSADIAKFVGDDHLYFYDAISPVVLAESINMKKVFRASRWGKRHLYQNSEGQIAQTTNVDGDYLNCPLSRTEYQNFYDALISSELSDVHDFDQAKFFEGCLPIEVMANRGVDTLRFGPMKPVGLIDPSTGLRPYAVVQLRQDDLAADHYSMVGFQTQMKWGHQSSVFRIIPGLDECEFVRHGMIHRNTYINAPKVLESTWQTRMRPELFFAGQISGVEGYVESAASGLVAGLNAVAVTQGCPTTIPPRTTALGALGYYVSNSSAINYQPANIAFGLIPSLDLPPKNKRDRKRAVAERALSDLSDWFGVFREKINENSSPVVS